MRSAANWRMGRPAMEGTARRREPTRHTDATAPRHASSPPAASTPKHPKHPMHPRRPRRSTWCVTAASPSAKMVPAVPLTLSQGSTTTPVRLFCTSTSCRCSCSFSPRTCEGGGAGHADGEADSGGVAPDMHERRAACPVLLYDAPGCPRGAGPTRIPDRSSLGTRPSLAPEGAWPRPWPTRTCQSAARSPPPRRCASPSGRPAPRASPCMAEQGQGQRRCRGCAAAMGFRTPAGPAALGPLLLLGRMPAAQGGALARARWAHGLAHMVPSWT